MTGSDVVLPACRMSRRRLMAVAALSVTASVTGGALATEVPDPAAPGDVTPDQWGIRQRVDETERICAMMQWASDHRRRIVWPDGGEYWLSQYSAIGPAVYADWHCAGQCTLKSLRTDTPGTNDYFIRLGGVSLAHTRLTASVEAGDSEITVASTKGAQVGQLALISTSKMIDTDHRGQARDGIVLAVDAVLSDTRLRLSAPLPFPISVGETAGKVAARPGPTQLQVKGLGLDTSMMRYRIRFTSGAAQGQIAYVVDYDPDAGILSCHPVHSTFPAAVAAGDDFIIERTADILLSAPVRARIEGLRLTRDPHRVTSPDRKTLGFVGLVLQRATQAVLRRLTVENFSDCGIRMEWCHGSDVTRIRLTGANRSFNVYDGTGYGMSVFQSSFGTYTDISGHTCRRLVDVGGTQGVSWYNRLRNLRSAGGGQSFAGEAYWPEGNLLVEVTGSHGAAAGTVYEDISGQDVSGLLNIRGLNETASGLRGWGRMDRMILIQYGGSGLVARDLRYDDGITEIGATLRRSNYEAASDWLNRRLISVIKFRTDNYGRTRLASMIGVQANGLQRCLFYGDVGKGAVENLVYGDIVVATDNATGKYPDFTLFGGQAMAGSNVVALNRPVVFNSTIFPKRKIAL